MGVAALRKLAVIDEFTANRLAGRTVAVDAHHWLYTYLTTTIRFTDEDVYTRDDGAEAAHLLGTLTGLPTLLQTGVTPLFVFDGTPAQQKQAELDRRDAARDQATENAAAARDAGDTTAVRQYKARAQRLTSDMIDSTKTLLDQLGIPYMDAPGAGEAQAAHLVRRGTTDAVLSDDYDTLLFGAPITIRQFTGNGPAERMVLQATLATHDLTHEDLVNIAILCGTDYNDGVHGVGPIRGIQAVKKHETLEAILDEYDAEIPEADTVRELFLDPTVQDYGGTPELGDPDLATARYFLTTEWDIDQTVIESDWKRLKRAVTS